MTDNKRTAFHWYRIAIQAVPAAGIGIYLAGFVVINAHLSKYQFLDLDLFNARYVISGTHFAIFLGLWYIFVGQGISPKLRSKTDFKRRNHTEICFTLQFVTHIQFVC